MHARMHTHTQMHAALALIQAGGRGPQIALQKPLYPSPRCALNARRLRAALQ